MAKQLNVNLKVSADIAAAQQSLRNLTLSLNTLKNQSSNLISPIGLQQAQEAARSLETHLSKAINVNTNKLDLTKFSLSLKQANQDLTTLSAKLLRGGQAGQQAFNALTHSISTASNASLYLGEKLNGLVTTLQNTARWQISSSILHGFMSTIQGAYTYAQKLNKSLTDIQIVTESSSEKMAQFAKEANKAAQALSTTTNTYAKAALIYYQQGLNDKQVKERTDLTIKMANVTGDTAKTASEQLTAIWNNFDDGTRSLESYVDTITALGAATASSTTEIAEGLEKFAAVATTVGLSYEYATAALATVTAKTRQSADVVGTAFKTLFARIQDLELGNTLDDGTTLGRYSEALNVIGVNVKNANGQLKDMDSILEEIGAKWNTIDRATQVAVAQTVGGTRQYNQFIAIMDNWDYMQENLKVAAESGGTLQRQADIYAESWEAAKDRVKAAAEEIYATLLDDKFFISLTNGFGKFLDIINNIVTSLGGMKTVLLAVIGLMSQKIAAQLPTLFTGIGEGAKGFAKKAAFSFGLNPSSKLDSQQEAILKKNVSLANDQYQAVAANPYALAITKGQAKVNATEASLAQKINDSNQRWNKAEQERNQALQDELQILSKIYLKKCQIVDKTTEETDETREDFINTLDDDKREDWKAAHPGKKYPGGVRGQHDRYTRETSDIIENNARYKAHAEFMSFRHTEQMGEFRAELKTIENMPEATKRQRAEKAKAEATLNQSINSYYDALQGDRAMKGADGRSFFGKAMAARRKNPRMSSAELLSLDNDGKMMNYAKDKISSYNEAIDEQLEKMKPETARKARVLAQQAAAEEQAKDQMETAEKQLDKPNEETNKRLQQTGVTLGALASTAIATATAVSAVTGAISVLGDDSATTGEKITAVVTTLSILVPLLPTIAGGINTLAVAFKTAGKSAAVAGAEGAAAGTAMQLAWWEITLIMLAIVAAITAVVVVFKLLSNAYNKDKIAAEKAAKAAATLAEQYDKIKASYEEMIKAISDYKEAEDALDKLTKGTEEYEKALKNANKQAQALIVKYKLLRGQDYSITDDGRIVIKDTVLKQIEDKQEAELNQAEAVSNIANNAAAAANNKSKTTNLMREVAGNKTKSGWLWGGIGGGLAAASLFIPVVGPLISSLIGAASIIGGAASQAKIESREAGMQAVIDKIAEGKLDVSGNLSYEEFKDTLKNANLNVDDEKLVKALYETKDSITDLAETEKQIKQTEEQNAYTFARDLFAQNDVIVAAGLTNDLATMGKRIILQAEETAEKGFKVAYENNGEEITRQFVEANAAALGKDAKYQGKGKYTYTDDSGKTQTGTIDETELKYFYKGNQGQKSITQNQDKILKTYNSIANNPYLKAMVVDGNFNSLTRDQWAANAQNYITPAMFGFDEKTTSKEELDTFAQTVLGAKSWEDWVSTVEKAGQDTEKAWKSFKGHAVEGIVDSNKNISLGTAQNFKNILDQFAKAPQYKENVTLITEGINQLANGSIEALEALSTLDYTSPEIGNQIRNTLINLDKPITLTNDAFNDLIDTIKSVSLAVPSYQTLYTTLNKINNVVKNLEFGSIIKEDDYDTLIKYNAALAQYFQKIGDDQYRFNSASVKNIKKAASDMARAQLDAARASAEAGRKILDNGYTPEVDMVSGLAGQDKQDYIEELIARWTNSGVFGLDVVAAKGITNKYLRDASDEQLQAAIKYINDLAAAGMDDSALREAREVFASTIDNVDDLNDALETGALTQKEYDKQLEYIINHAKEALTVAEAINEALEYQNKLLDRQSTIVDTLYGNARLAALEEERNILADNIKLTEKKIQQLEIEAGLQAGALAMKGVTFDANGRPENLDELYWAGKITDEERSNYLKVFNEFLDAQDDLLEMQIKRQELYYQKLTEALENQLDLIDMDRIKLEYDYKKIEDDVYRAAEGFSLLKKQQDLTFDSLELYKGQIEKLQKAYAAGEITQADYVEGLKEIYNKIYDNLEAFDDLDEQMREYYTNTLAKINEELDKYISKMEHLTELTDHYKSIITLISGENDYERLGLIYAAAGQNAQNQLSVALERQRAAKEQLEFLHSQPAALAEDIEAAEKQVQETTNAVFEATQDLLEITKETALNNIEKVGAELEKTLTGGSTFDRINQAMSMRSKYVELFYTQTNQVYETQKRINQVEQEIAKTTNKAYSNELKLWKQRLESAQKQEKLSKNQLALMDAEFKLIQARAAFEEAQNAKSTVRLTRDAEGNYGYVFTADQDNIAKAQQNVLDAENELYNKQLEITNKNAEQIVQIQQEMFNKIQEINTDLTLSAEERELRIQEIYQQYSPYILALTNDRNMAISYSEDNTAKIMRDAWSMTFEETIKKCSSWQEAYQTYTEQCSKYLDEWYEVVDQVTQQVGLDFDTLKTAMSEVSDESQALRDQLIGENGLIEALNQVALQVLQQTSIYAGLRDQLLSVAEGYAQAAQQCRDYIAAAQEAAAYQGGDYSQFNPITNVYWSADDKGNLNIYDADTGKLIGSNKVSSTSSQLKEKMESLKERAQEKGLSDDERQKRAEEWKAARDEYDASLVSDAEKVINGNKYMNIIPDDEAWDFDTAKAALNASSAEHAKKANEYNNKIQSTTSKGEEEDKTEPTIAVNGTVNYKFKHSEKVFDNKFSFWKSNDSYLKSLDLSLDDYNKQLLTDTQGKKWFPIWHSQDDMTYNTPMGYIPESELITDSYTDIYGKQGVLVEYPDIVQIYDLIKSTASYDTGGYTGKWGPEGKLATLHEKELILNKQDTQNILAAVGLIRQIASAIDLQALMQSFGLLSVGATKIGIPTHTGLEQKVEITAQFPNAIYHDEIKEAFDTLINRASQYANRNY